MPRHWATPKEIRVDGLSKISGTSGNDAERKKREEMPSCSQAMQCKPLLHVPPTSTPTESAVLGDEKNSLR